MSDNPENQVPDPEGSADDALQPGKDQGQTWPPDGGESADSGVESDGGSGDVGGSEDVSGMDAAIEELRRLDGGAEAGLDDGPSGGLEAGEGLSEVVGSAEDLEEIGELLESELDAALQEDVGLEAGDSAVDQGAAGKSRPAREAPVGAVGQGEGGGLDGGVSGREGESAELSSAEDGADRMVAAVLRTPGEETGETPVPPVTPGGPAGQVKSVGVQAGCQIREKSEDELGRLWGNIFFSAEHAPPRAIVVTAARSRDGATQISVGLALVGAEASTERRIALVDFNLRDPGIADLLGIPSEPGLTDVLDGRCTLESAMQAVTLRNGNQLHVLTSGAVVDKPLGLLKSRQVQSLIGQLQDLYDHTLIDIAAAGEHPDPQVVGALVDGALFVAKAGDTPRETVAAAKKRLDLAGVRWLGLVLNQRVDPIPEFLYRMT